MKNNPHILINRPHFLGFLRSFFIKKIGFSKSWAYGLVRGLKHTLNPGQRSLRKTLASQMAVTHPIKDGYRLFQPLDFPEIPAVVAQCQKIAANKLKDLPAVLKQYTQNKEDFLVTVLEGKEFLSQLDLMRFAVSRPVLDQASKYFSSVPLLTSARLWLSPPNQTLKSSQLFHVDVEDRTQLKMFINIGDITEEHGPLAFLPTNTSDRVVKKIHLKKYSGMRLSDEKVLSLENQRQLIKLTGPAGSGGFVDTSRCLHYGSRANLYNRLVLMLQYQRFDTPATSRAFFDVPPDYSLLPSLDTVQKLALGYKN